MNGHNIIGPQNNENKLGPTSEGSHSMLPTALLK